MNESCFVCGVEFEDAKHERSHEWRGLIKTIKGKARTMCDYCAQEVPYFIVKIACGEEESNVDYGITFDENNWMTHKSIRNVGSCAVSKPSVSKKDYPHVCPRCGAPAYLGLTSVDCSRCGKT